MRERAEPKALFDDLEASGNIVVHSTAEEAWEAITADVDVRAEAGASVAVAVAVAVAINGQATELNALVQAAHTDAGRTRQTAVEVANRDTWAVDRVDRDGSVTVSDGAREARLPREYVEEDTHLAYASTEYGVQGATVDYGHGVVTDSSTAQAVYVAATRGREHDVLHIVAGDRQEARDVFVSAMTREGGDHGIDAARAAAQRDLEGVVLPEHDHDLQLRAARLAAEERVFQSEMRAWEAERERWQERNPDVPG